ncbi:MAG: hypothetical protein WCD69_12290 [Xanthobacteraceae bacterium]
MSDQHNHQKQQGAGDQQKPGQQQQQQRPNQKPGQAGNEQRDQQKQKGGQGDQHQQQAHMSTDQISFYDESLKKQIEGSFKSDGNYIHVSSAYGIKSVPYSDLGACIDYNAQVLVAQKLLSELARDPGSGKFKDLQQGKDDQQRQSESFSVWGQGAVGTNP